MFVLAVLWGCAQPPAHDLGLGATVEDPAGGMCVAALLNRWDPTHLPVQIAALQALGARTVRQDLRWEGVQPAPDVWDWSLEDPVQAALADADIETIAMLGYGTSWATSVEGADEFFPPDDPADFAAFAAAATERYGDRVKRWEIWNEPNSGFRFWKSDPPSLSGDPAAYAELFVAAADAIHAVDPDAEVQLGSLFFHEQGIIGAVRFLEQAVAARPDLLDKADAVSFHPYTLYPPRVPPEAGEGDETPIWEMFGELRAVTGDLPLVITEAGWPSWGDLDEQDQAAWLGRLFALSQAHGVRDVCWYTLEDGDDPTHNSEHAFGLYRRGALERKPSGEAFAAISAALAGTTAAHGRAEDALGLPAGVLAARWSGPDRSVTAIWSVAGPVDVELPQRCGPAVSLRATEAPAWVVDAGCD